MTNHKPISLTARLAINPNLYLIPVLSKKLGCGMDSQIRI